VAARRVGPTGQMDRRPRRSFSSPIIRDATTRPRRSFRARCRGAFSGVCGSAASPISAPISKAAPAAVQTFQYAFLPGTVYRIPAIELIVSAVFTNTAPIGVLRGPGYGEAVNIMERLVDAAARQCGFDRAELRRRNMPAAAAMPVTNAFGNKIDSGAFPETVGPRARGGRCRRVCVAPHRGRAARASARSRPCLSHQGTGGAPSEMSMSVRGRRDGVADHRDADDRPVHETDVPADPRRPPWLAGTRRSGSCRATPI